MSRMSKFCLRIRYSNRSSGPSKVSSSTSSASGGMYRSLGMRRSGSPWMRASTGRSASGSGLGSSAFLPFFFLPEVAVVPSAAPASLTGGATASFLPSAGGCASAPSPSSGGWATASSPPSGGCATASSPPSGAGTIASPSPSEGDAGDWAEGVSSLMGVLASPAAGAPPAWSATGLSLSCMQGLPYSAASAAAGAGVTSVWYG